MILFDVWKQWTQSVFGKHRLLLLRKLFSQPGRDPCTVGVGFLSYVFRQLYYRCLHMSELSKLPCKQHTLLERDLCPPRTDIWNRQGKLQSSCTCLSWKASFSKWRSWNWLNVSLHRQYFAKKAILPSHTTVRKHMAISIIYEYTWQHIRWTALSKCPIYLWVRYKTVSPGWYILV